MIYILPTNQWQTNLGYRTKDNAGLPIDQQNATVPQVIPARSNSGFGTEAHADICFFLQRTSEDASLPSLAQSSRATRAKRIHHAPIFDHILSKPSAVSLQNDLKWIDQSIKSIKSIITTVPQVIPARSNSGLGTEAHARMPKKPTWNYFFFKLDISLTLSIPRILSPCITGLIITNKVDIYISIEYEQQIKKSKETLAYEQWLKLRWTRTRHLTNNENGPSWIKPDTISFQWIHVCLRAFSCWHRIKNNHSPSKPFPPSIIQCWCPNNHNYK